MHGPLVAVAQWWTPPRRSDTHEPTDWLDATVPPPCTHGAVRPPWIGDQVAVPVGPCSHDHPKLRYHNSFLVADPGGANLNKGRDFPQTIPYWTDKHIKDRGTPPYTPPPDWEYNTNAGPVEGKINVHIVPHTHDDTGWQVSRAPLAGRSPCLF